MGSRIKSLLFGKSSINNNSLQGQSYDTTVALDPPVKGSYPVAGNGPNVLEDLNRLRIQRQSVTPSVAPPPTVPLHRNNATERPSTAPHNGMPGGGKSAAFDAGGRTPSGFSMKSPPTFFSSSRRSSITSVRSSRGNSQRKLQKNPPLTFPASTPQGNLTKEIRTYVPTSGSTSRSNRSRPPDSFAPHAKHLHNRNASHITSATSASHKSYVDLLDAHSTIDRSREASRHRTKASGIRDYGEDVADRNIADFGEKGDKGLDLNSPEFSYLKQVYRPKKRGATKSSTEPHSRVDSALGHVQGSDGSSDDTPPQTQSSSQRTTSIRSFTAPRPGFAYPPRRDSRSPRTTTSTSLYDDDPSNSSQERRGRAMSPLASNPTTIHEGQPQDRRQRPVVSSIAVSTPTIPKRGEGRPGSLASVKAFVEPSPAPAVKITSPPRSRPSSSQSEMVFGLRSKSNRRSVSGQGNVPPLPNTNGTTVNGNAIAAALAANDNSINAKPSALNEVSPPVNGRTYKPTSVTNSSNKETRMPTTNATRSRSTSYSAFPSSGPRTRSNSDIDKPLPGMVPTGSAHGKRRDMIVSGASEPPSLDGVVDLKDSVDTEVTTKTQPAVVHEHVLPARHEIREERITREIHTHDVYHRILPIIETEILPTKHYIPSSDGKSLVEIPESQVPNYTITGTVPNNWHIASGPPSKVPLNSPNQYPPSHTLNQNEDDDELAADPPIIGLARGEPKNRSRSNTAKSYKSHKSQTSAGSPPKPILEPFLSSKKESVTKEGVPRTEYVWRHPPVFETADGKKTPAYIPAAFGQPSNFNSTGSGRREPEFYSYSSEDEDVAGAEFGAEKVESDLLFRDSGYGSGGMLPGLVDTSPTATGKGKAVGRPRGYSEARRKALPASSTVGVEKSMKDMNIR